jgi:hypothetical protein
MKHKPARIASTDVAITAFMMRMAATQQQQIDRLLARYRSDSRLLDAPELKPLTEFCEAEQLPQDWWELNGYGEALMPGREVFLAQSWPDIAENFTDDALRDRREWSDARKVTDVDRMAEIRYLVRQAVTTIDAEQAWFMCGGLPIRSTGGREAVLGFGYFESGFGPDCTWFGVFDDDEEFRDWMRRSEWCTGMADLKALGDRALEMWRRRG